MLPRCTAQPRLRALHSTSPAQPAGYVWFGPYNIPMKKFVPVKPFLSITRKKQNPQEQYDKKKKSEWANEFLFSNLLLAWGMTRGALWLSLITIRQPRHRSSGTFLNQVGTNMSIKWHIKGQVLSRRINLSFVSTTADRNSAGFSQTLRFSFFCIIKIFVRDKSMR